MGNKPSSEQSLPPHPPEPVIRPMSAPKANLRLPAATAPKVPNTRKNNKPIVLNNSNSNVPDISRLDKYINDLLADIYSIHKKELYSVKVYGINPNDSPITEGESYKNILFEIGRLIASTDTEGVAPIHKGHVKEPYEKFLKHIVQLRTNLDVFKDILSSADKDRLIGYIDYYLKPIMVYNIAKEKYPGSEKYLPEGRKRKNTRKTYNRYNNSRSVAATSGNINESTQRELYEIQEAMIAAQSMINALKTSKKPENVTEVTRIKRELTKLRKRQTALMGLS